jgi:pimeloyl-ACP methyl ester carboxylesterase
MSGAPIVIVGGATWWPGSYRNFASLLREISGSEVHMVPLTPLDWTLGYFRGFGQLVFEVASTVDRALLETEAKKVVLVGHSAGGLACRVYIGGDSPYGGRRYSGHRRVQTLITLGTPHTVADKPRLAPISRVNELFPGALHAEAGLRYVSVAGSAADGTSSPGARKRYERFVEDGRVASITTGVSVVGTARTRRRWGCGGRRSCARVALSWETRVRNRAWLAGRGEDAT